MHAYEKILQKNRENKMKWNEKKNCLPYEI